MSSLDLYRSMVRIRAFEDALLKLSQDGILRGSLHLARGQEALPAGVCAALRRDDYLTFTYRGHGYALAKGCDLKAVLAEVLGRATGICGGYGGKMHLMDPSNGLLGANGIVGAGVPIAAGGALAALMDGTDQVAVTVLGDGALNQGVTMETLNIASLYRLPLILICENNYYAEMTPLSRSTAVTSLVDKARGFGISAAVVDGNDAEAVFMAAQQAVGAARSGKGPQFIEALTYRISGHYQLDPGTSYRPAEEVKEWEAKDPIQALRRKLLNQVSKLDGIDQDVAAEMEQVVAWATSQPEPSPGDLTQKVFV